MKLALRDCLTTGCRRKARAVPVTCNFQCMEISTAGTIDDVVQDAAAAGYKASRRLVRDWTAKSLLDAPRRRPRGRGKGSKPALYSPSQRTLFLVLLHHRHQGAPIAGLARIPVALWLYFPDALVSGEHARRAFTTWLADPRSSLSEARRLAVETTARLASSGASQPSRKALEALLTDIAYRGALDDEAMLRLAVRDVFEPGFDGISKAVGHPSAALSTDAVVDVIRANLEGVRLVTGRLLGPTEFEHAGRVQREAMAEYIRDHALMTSEPWASAATFYEEPSLQWMVEQSCSQLLTILGLRSLSRAA